MSRRTRTTSSPYAKYGKQPYTYSAAYQTWAAALGSSGAGFATERYFEADRQFRRTFGLPAPAANYGQVFGGDDA